MSQAADGAKVPSAQERSTAELVRQMSEEVSSLVRDELQLARIEMTRKGKEAGKGMGMLGGAGLIALYGIGCLIACAIIAIAGVLSAWLAALIIGALLLAVAGVAAALGKERLRRGTPPVPQEAVGSVKADVETIKEKARR